MKKLSLTLASVMLAFSALAGLNPVTQNPFTTNTPGNLPGIAFVATPNTRWSVSQSGPTNLVTLTVTGTNGPVNLYPTNGVYFVTNSDGSISIGSTGGGGGFTNPFSANFRTNQSGAIDLATNAQIYYATNAGNLAGIAPGSIVTNSVNLNAVSTGNQTNLFITNCPIAGLNGLYVLQTANPTATSYSWWKQSGGTNYVTQNDPNYYSGGTPYYYSVGPNTNDSAGAVFYQNIALAVFQSNWQTNIGTVSSPPSGKMIAYFLQPALTNSAVMYPPESVTNQWYVDFSELGNDLNDGRTKFTPFRTVGRAVTMSSSNSIINLSSGWSTNDIPNVVLNLNPGTTLIGQGYSTTLTNLIINMADNCSLQKFRASTSLGIQFANVDSANKYILIDSIDFTAPTDGLYTGSIYGRMDVINSRFHSINDTVNFAVYGLLNVSYCTFECLNIPNASGVPQRTFHLIGGSGLAALNFCTFTISNSVSGGFGVGATNECVGTAGPTIQLNNCSLNNWQATNSLAINPTASGTIHGNYVLNGTNQVSIDGFTGSINASNLTGTVQAAQLNGATNALGTTMGTVTTNTISSGTNSVVVSSTNVVINIPATGNFSINVGGVSVLSVTNGVAYGNGGGLTNYFLFDTSQSNITFNLVPGQYYVWKPSLLNTLYLVGNGQTNSVIGSQIAPIITVGTNFYIGN